MAIDAEITSVDEPADGTGSCAGPVTPEVTLRNRGTTTLTSVTIQYRVDGGAWNNYPWTGSLASSASETVVLPAVSIAAGNHDLDVTVSNPNGSADQNPANDSSTSNFDAIDGSGQALPLTADFETATFPPNPFTLQNPDNADTWERSTAAGGFGNSTASAYIDNFDYDAAGQTDYIITPFMDMSGVTSPELSFDVAYARYSANYSDGMRVLVSNNCGGSWDVVFDKAGTTP